MQIKNRKKILLPFFLGFLLFNLNVYAEEFDISAKEIVINKDDEIIIGKGSVLATDSEGKRVNANKVTYEKSREFLLAEGDVKIADIDGNILKSNKATFDKINEKIVTYDYTELILKEGYKLISKDITYNTEEKILSSNQKSIFTDNDGNIVETTMFQYNINDNLFSSVGEIKVIDIKKK